AHLCNVGLPGPDQNHGYCACSGIPPEQLAQGRQDSNLQPAVLETAALPIAPLPYGRKTNPAALASFHWGARHHPCFNTGEQVYATTSSTSNQPRSGPSRRPCGCPWPAVTSTPAI